MPQNNPHTDSPDETGDGPFSVLDKNDPAAIEAVAAYRAWATKYIPVKVDYGEDPLREMPPSWDERKVWSRFCDDYTFLVSGFVAERDSRRDLMGYVFTKNPRADDVFESVTTELQNWCERCEGSGTTANGPCQDCEGMGTQYFDVEDQFLIEEKLRDVATRGAGQGVAKFCSECGRPRKNMSANFCSNCGGAF